MKIHCYFLLNIKHGASQLYWGRPPNTTMRPREGGVVVGMGGLRGKGSNCSAGTGSLLMVASVKLSVFSQ